MKQYKEFEDEIISMLQVYYRRENNVEIRVIHNKNGFSIYKTGQFVLFFDLTQQYQIYISGKTTLEDLAADIIVQINNKDDSVEGISYWFQLLSEVKQNIFYGLINYEKNKEILEEVPYIIFLDMAIVLYVGFSADDGRYYRCIMTNRLMEFWNLEFQELYMIAKNNTVKKQPAVIKSLEEIIWDEIKKIKTDVMENGISLDTAENFMNLLMLKNAGDLEWYVVTNSVHIYGAACMLYPDVLGDIAKKLGTDLFIIPASIHEIIVVPVLAGIDGNKVRKMVREVSGQDKDKEYWLSNRLYLFKEEFNQIILYDE